MVSRETVGLYLVSGFLCLLLNLACVNGQLCTAEPIMPDCTHSNGTDTVLDLTPAFDGPNYNGGRAGFMQYKNAAKTIVATDYRTGLPARECFYPGELGTAGCEACSWCWFYLAKRPGWTQTITAPNDKRVLSLSMHGYGECNRSVSAFMHNEEIYCDGILCIFLGQGFPYDEPVYQYNTQSVDSGICKFADPDPALGTGSTYSLDNYGVLKVEFSLPSSVEFVQHIHQIDGSRGPLQGHQLVADGYTFNMPAKTGQFPGMTRTAGAVFGRSVKDGSVVLPSSIVAGSGVTLGKTADMSVADAQGLGLRVVGTTQLPVFEATTYDTSNVTLYGKDERLYPPDCTPYDPRGRGSINGCVLTSGTDEFMHDVSNTIDMFMANLTFSESIDAIFYLFTFADTMAADYGKWYAPYPLKPILEEIGWMKQQYVQNGYSIPQTTDYWPTFGCGGQCGMPQLHTYQVMEPLTNVYTTGVCEAPVRVGATLTYNLDIQSTADTGFCGEVRKCIIRPIGLPTTSPAGNDLYFCEGNFEERLTNTTLVVDFP
jgi:hypothetical protein